MGADESNTTRDKDADDIIEIDSTDSNTFDFTNLPAGELQFSFTLENF